VAFAAAACGGEIIEYGASPTPTATPMFTVTLELVGDETLTYEPSLGGSLDAIESILRERESYTIDPSIHVANPELEFLLRRWARNVSEGATSRAELAAICVEGLAGDRTGFGRDAISICEMVIGDPHARTLRGWADLIEERYRSYRDIREYDDLFGTEDEE
jgi:hypothetical protein